MSLSRTKTAIRLWTQTTLLLPFFLREGSFEAADHKKNVHRTDKVYFLLFLSISCLWRRLWWRYFGRKLSVVMLHCLSLLEPIKNERKTSEIVITCEVLLSVTMTKVLTISWSKLKLAFHGRKRIVSDCLQRRLWRFHNFLIIINGVWNVL